MEFFEYDYEHRRAEHDSGALSLSPIVTNRASPVAAKRTGLPQAEIPFAGPIPVRDGPGKAGDPPFPEETSIGPAALKRSDDLQCQHGCLIV